MPVKFILITHVCEKTDGIGIHVHVCLCNACFTLTTFQMSVLFTLIVLTYQKDNHHASVFNVC
jgi:hypothetical protein